MNCSNIEFTVLELQKIAKIEASKQDQSLDWDKGFHHGIASAAKSYASDIFANLGNDLYIDFLLDDEKKYSDALCQNAGNHKSFQQGLNAAFLAIVRLSHGLLSANDIQTFFSCEDEEPYLWTKLEIQQHAINSFPLIN